METEPIKMSSHDFTGELKCPSPSGVLVEPPKAERDLKPEAGTQGLRIVEALDHSEGASPETNAKGALDRKKYHNISNDIRQQLIDAVDGHGEKIKHAANRLDINYSSAKSIFQVYKREGRMNKKAYKTRVHKDTPNSKHVDSSLKVDDKRSLLKADLQANLTECFQEPQIHKKLQTAGFTIQTPNLLANFAHCPPGTQSKSTNGEIHVSQTNYQDPQKLDTNNSNQTAFVKVTRPGQYINVQSQPQIVYMNLNGSVNGFNGMSNINAANTGNGMSTISSTSTQVNFSNPNAPKQMSSGYQAYGAGQINGYQMAYPIYYTSNQSSVSSYPIMMQATTMSNFMPQNQQHVVLQQQQQQQQPMQAQHLPQYQPVVYVLPAGSNVQYVPQNYFQGANITTISTNTSNISSNTNIQGNNSQNVNGSYYIMPKKVDMPENMEAVPSDQFHDSMNVTSMKITTE